MNGPTVRELVNGVTSDDVLHILWRDRDHVVTPICTDDELPGLVLWQGFDAVPSCTGCLAAFCAVDDAVWSVMTYGDRLIWCRSCGKQAWTPPSRAGEQYVRLCWTCREREDRAATTVEGRGGAL